MADLTEVYAALQKADAAGDTAGAKQLADYIRAQPTSASSPQQAPQQSPLPSFADYAKSYGSAAIRPIANAVTALPLMAMDAGVAVRNIGGNAYNSLMGNQPTPNYTMPSAMYRQSLDSLTQAPDSTVGRVAELGSSIVAGGLTAPMLPKASPQMFASDQLAPASFISPASAARQQALQIAQRQGYVVPPSQSNPSFMNRLMEGISGKLKLQQEAMQQNQPVTTRIASEAIGQNPEAPLTQGSLAAIRQDAVQAGYAPIRDIGTITPTSAYTAALDKIVQATQGASKSFPGIKTPDVEGIVAPLRQASFDSGDAVDAISVLRGQADEAYRAGQGQAGRAFKGAAKALEDAIEQHLQDQGENGASTLQAFRDARTQIAKSIDIGKALNEGTGQVSATKLAQMASRSPGRMSGGLQDIATFARAYPKVSREVTDVFPSVSPLDAYGSAIAAGAAHSSAPLMIPLSRVALRSYLLSPAGQARAIQQAPNIDTGLGVLNSIPQFGLAALRP